MADNRLERVSLDQINDDDLPYPGQNAPAGFSGAEGIDAPFRAPAAQKAVKGNSIDVGDYDPTKPNAANKPVTQPAPQKAEPEPSKMQDPPKAKPKMTQQLQRFREAFGVKRVQIAPFTVVRKSPDGSDNISCTFQFRGLKYEDFQWAVARATELTRVADLPLVAAWNLAATAISLCAFDFDLNEGDRPTPLHEIFGIQVEDSSQIKDPYYPVATVRMNAADMMLAELSESLFDFAVDLTNFVETNILTQTQAMVREKEEEGPLA
jgi:hypothetical protein